MCVPDPLFCTPDLLRESLCNRLESLVVLVLGSICYGPSCEHCLHLLVEVLDGAELQLLELLSDRLDADKVPIALSAVRVKT